MESYETLGVIGEGTYGVVIKARHRASGQLVAIKKFKQADDDDHVRKTSLREVRVLKQLHHPNVVALLDVFRRDGKLYLVFEYIENTILQLLEGTEAGLSPADVRRYMYQLLRGIDYCHAHSVIHRDVKPENILVSEDKVLKVCDFGFARHLTSKGKYTDYVATRWYRAPELLVGDVNYGKAVDIWAIGCIFAEISDTQPLFPGDSDLDQLSLILRACGPIPQRFVQTFERNPLYRRVSFPHTRIKQSLEQRFRFESTDWLEFFLACLQTDPDKRPSCAELMNLPYFTRDNFRYDYEQQLRRLNAPSLSTRPAESATTKLPASSTTTTTPVPTGVTMSELPSLTLGSQPLGGTLGGSSGAVHPMHHVPHDGPDFAAETTHLPPPTTAAIPTASGTTATYPGGSKSLYAPPSPASPHSRGGAVEPPAESLRPALPEITVRRTSQQPPPAAAAMAASQDVTMIGTRIGGESLSPSVSTAITAVAPNGGAIASSHGYGLDSDSRPPGSRHAVPPVAGAASTGGFPQLSVLWAQYLGENSPGASGSGATNSSQPSLQSTLYNNNNNNNIGGGGGPSHSSKHTTTEYSLLASPHTTASSSPPLGKRSSGLFNALMTSSSTRTSLTAAHELTGPVAMAMTGLAPTASFHSASQLPAPTGGRFGAELDGAGLSGAGHLPPLAGPSPTTGSSSSAAVAITTAPGPALTPSALVGSTGQVAPSRSGVPTPLSVSAAALQRKSPQPPPRHSLAALPLSPIQQATTAVASPVGLSGDSSSTTATSGRGGSAGRLALPAAALGAELADVPESSTSTLFTPNASGKKGRKKKGNAHEPAIAAGASPIAPPRRSMPSGSATVAESAASARPNAESQPPTVPLPLDDAPGPSPVSAPASVVTVMRVRLDSALLCASPVESTTPRVVPVSSQLTEVKAAPSPASRTAVPDAAIPARRATLTATIEVTRTAKDSEEASDEGTNRTIAGGGDSSGSPSSLSSKHEPAAEVARASPTAPAGPRPPSSRPTSTSSSAARQRSPQLRPASREPPQSDSAVPSRTVAVTPPAPTESDAGSPCTPPANERTPAYRETAPPPRSLETILANSAAVLGLATASPSPPRVSAVSSTADTSISPDLTAPSTTRVTGGGGGGGGGSPRKHHAPAKDPLSPRQQTKRLYDVRPLPTGELAEAEASATDTTRTSAGSASGSAVGGRGSQTPADTSADPLPGQRTARAGGGAARGVNRRLSSRTKGAVKKTTGRLAVTGSPGVSTGAAVVRKKRRGGARRSVSTSSSPPTPMDTATASPVPSTSVTSPSPARVHNDTGLNLTPLREGDNNLLRQRFAQYYRANTKGGSVGPTGHTPRTTLEKLPKAGGSQKASGQTAASKSPSQRGSPQRENDSPRASPALSGLAGARRSQPHTGVYNTSLGQARGKAPRNSVGATAARGSGVRAPTLHELVMAPYETKRKSHAGAGRPAVPAPVDTHEERQERIDTLSLYTRPAHLHTTPTPSTPPPPEETGGTSGPALARLRRGPGGNHTINHAAGLSGAQPRAKAYGASARTQPATSRTGAMKS